MFTDFKQVFLFVTHSLFALSHLNSCCFEPEGASKLSGYGDSVLSLFSPDRFRLMGRVSGLVLLSY